MTVAFMQPEGALSGADQKAIEGILDRLNVYAKANSVALSYYESRQDVDHLGVGIPPELAAKIKAVIGWGGTVADVVDERLDFLGWSDAGDAPLGLDAIYAANNLGVESGAAHLDALICGVSFVRVGRGGEGEPEVLITTHSPRDTTGTWDARTRRLTLAVTVMERTDDRQPCEIVVDTPGVTSVLRKIGAHWVEIDRDEHGLPEIPVVLVSNRARGSRRLGRSEITRAVRYYCDAAVRTLVGMEGNREFYSIPQLALLNRGLDSFVDAHGNPTSAWRVLAGHMIGMPADEDGESAEIQQLSVSSPQPFLEQVRGIAQLLAAEIGIPTAYLGFHTDNPSSADAIRAGEARLVKRVERRQATFGRAWVDVARLALLVRDGELPDDFWTRVSPRWRDAATPTRAATADETVKYVGAGVLPADSQVTRDRMNLTPAEQAILEAESRRSVGRVQLDRILGRDAETEA